MERKRLMIYGDIGGSGGYINYLNGLLGYSNLNLRFDVLFICSLKLLNRLQIQVDSVNVVTHPYIDHPNFMARVVWYFWLFPRLVRSFGADIEFYPAGQIRNYYSFRKKIVTVHNLLIFDDYELSRLKSRSELSFYMKYRFRQLKSYRRASGIILLSSYSRQFLYGQLKSKALSAVIGHGVSANYYLSGCRNYEIEGKVKILYVSPFFTYKNQLKVIDAISQIHSSGTEVNLNLVGGGSELNRQEIIVHINGLNLKEEVIVDTYLSEEELLKKYKDADIFIFASSCESFGITLLEAMANGLPIACSDRSGLVSILRDGGLYFDPENVESLRSTIIELIDNVQLRSRLGQRSASLARQYTWEKCSDETFNFINLL